MPCPDFHLSRRSAIRSLLGGSLIMPAVMSDLLAGGGAPSGVVPRRPLYDAKAKRVIFIYLTGGMSHVDSFDYKPDLERLGKQGGGKEKYLPPQWQFKARGQSGLQVSDLFPHIAGCADDLCVIRSMYGDHNNHAPATLGIHTGSFTVARPSIGSWVSFGLGTENQNLPSFVVLAPKMPYGGGLAWGADFLPGEHQGTRVVPGDEPVPNLKRSAPSGEIQQMELDLLAQYNRIHLGEAGRGSDPQLRARIQSYQTAFGMQMQMPEALDLSGESDATHRLYGLERGSTKGFAWQCLVARRLAERGVRFIELIDTGASGNWDAHSNIKSHEPLARNVDKPVAGLLRDLKSRGMLDDTLVVFTTEFGRTPKADGTTGRGHHCHAFTSWLVRRRKGRLRPRDD
ncbi:MAG: DUF1501 domain-containing protein [Verrucomicrobiales bacterium]